jgi:hypothetical protein
MVAELDAKPLVGFCVAVMSSPRHNSTRCPLLTKVQHIASHAVNSEFSVAKQYRVIKSLSKQICLLLKMRLQGIDLNLRRERKTDQEMIIKGMRCSLLIK